MKNSMLDFKGISHVSRKPNGTFSVAGSVPATCLRWQSPPTREQIMAGRTKMQQNCGLLQLRARMKEKF